MMLLANILHSLLIWPAAVPSSSSSRSCFVVCLAVYLLTLTSITAVPIAIYGQSERVVAWQTVLCLFYARVLCVLLVYLMLVTPAARPLEHFLLQLSGHFT